MSGTSGTMGATDATAWKGRLFASPQTIRREGADGVIYLSSGIRPGPAARCVGDWLETAAQLSPQRIFMAERDGPDGWRRMGYAAFRTRAREIGDWLLSAGATADRPVAILSENSIDHALLAFAAMHVGIPSPRSRRPIR